MKSKVPLQGAELEEYLAKERAAREREAASQAALARQQRILEADEGDSDSEDDEEEEDEVRRALGQDDDPEERALKRHKGDGGDGADWNNMDDEGFTKQLLSFDIYIKGNVSKATTFFKNVGGQTHRFRMFPYVEKKRRVDEYGETIDVGMWLRKSKIFEEEAESDDIKDYRRRQAEEEMKVYCRFGHIYESIC